MKTSVIRLSCLVLFAWFPAAAATAQQSEPLSLDPGDGSGGKEQVDRDINPEDVIHWEAVSAETNGQGKIQVGLRLSTERNFTIYRTKLDFFGPSGYSLESITPPDVKRITDPITEKEVAVYDGGEFEITFTGSEAWTKDTFPISLRYVGCTQVICLFPHTEDLEAKAYKRTPEPAATATSGSMEDGATETEGTASQSAAAAAGTEKSFSTKWADRLKAGGVSFWVLLGIVFLGGILSNLTPCVYPMIPITLRVLGAQTSHPLAGSAAYALGIVITYSALGLVAAWSGVMFGSFLASTTFNVVFAIVMILLGLGMLGFGNLSKLQTVGSRLGAGKPTLKNKFLMGTGAGLVAAPCTGPILAALLAYAARSHSMGESMSLLSIYSVGFALPYMLLGGAAAKASKIQVPHQVQVGIKLLFASIMFGLGIYYLRIPFYETFTSLHSEWAPIAATGLIAGVLIGAVWVIVPRLHDSKVSMILPATILGIGFFAGSQWATTGASEAKKQMTWHHTQEQAYEAAKRTGKPVLIDMWAEWCEACKKMDRTTFGNEKVKRRLAEDWTLLKLDLTQSNDKNDAIQEKYKLQSLPTLVMVPPSGNLAGMEAITGYVGPKTLLQRLRRFNSHEAE